MSEKSTNGKMIPTKHVGVYQREGGGKRYDGKPDTCYYITYKQLDGKKVWEKIGWRSEKMTAALAYDIRADRMQQIRLGAAAFSGVMEESESGWFILAPAFDGIFIAAALVLFPHIYNAEE